MSYKVPFRQCYCFSFSDWWKWTLWCHVVLKVFPHAKDFGSDSMIKIYLEEPQVFFEQYKESLKLAVGSPK